MSRTQLDTLLAEIRTLRAEVLAELVDLSEADFSTPTPSPRWSDIRRVLLRFGDHMREYANQVEGARLAAGAPPTMPQRMLAEAELAWGKLLAATVGLSDEEINVTPSDGGWSVQRVLEHVRQVEGDYLQMIRNARRAQKPES